MLSSWMAALTLLVLSCACYAGVEQEARKNSSARRISANTLTSSNDVLS